MHRSIACFHSVAGRPWAVAIAAAVVAACVPPSQTSSHARSKSELTTVSFDSARDVIVIPGQFPDDTARGTLSGVLEISGLPVVDHTDTLIIQPWRIAVQDRAHVDGHRVLVKGGRFTLPWRAIIPVEPTMHVSDWRPPTFAASWTEKLDSMRTVYVLAAIGALLYVRYYRW